MQWTRTAIQKIISMELKHIITFRKFQSAFMRSFHRIVSHSWNIIVESHKAIRLDQVMIFILVPTFFNCIGGFKHTPFFLFIIFVRFVKLTQKCQNWYYRSNEYVCMTFIQLLVNNLLLVTLINLTNRK